MNGQEQNPVSTTRLPPGFFHVRFDHVLYIVGMTIVMSSMIASKGAEYVLYILLPVVLVLGAISVVARRGVRSFVRKHGKVDIRITFSPEGMIPKKSIFLREVGELVDAGVDKVLDGKQKDSP